jgi:hypothetical protein
VLEGPAGRLYRCAALRSEAVRDPGLGSVSSHDLVEARRLRG